MEIAQKAYGLSDSEVKSILDRILVYKLYSLSELDALYVFILMFRISNMGMYLAGNPVQLLIVDSVAALVRGAQHPDPHKKEEDGGYLRTELLNLINKLKYFALLIRGKWLRSIPLPS